MCRTTFMPSGIRLRQLIQNQYKEILAREKNNDKFIHLYDIGAYWVAFISSFICMTLARIGWLSSVPPVG